jgi:hypothetical protein
MRLSTHVYNFPAQIDTVVGLLGDVAAHARSFRLP